MVRWCRVCRAVHLACGRKEMSEGRRDEGLGAGKRIQGISEPRPERVWKARLAEKQRRGVWRLAGHDAVPTPCGWNRWHSGRSRGNRGPGEV